MCIQSMNYPQTERITDDTFDNVLSHIPSMRIPSVCMNHTTEPLLDKKNFERIRTIAAIETVVDIQMNTNAVRLNERTAAQLLNSGLTRLLIGFDAYSKKVYETVRVGAKYETVNCKCLRFS